MKVHGWLWVSGVFFVTPPAISLNRYYDSIEGPLAYASEAALAAVAGQPVSANCTTLQPISSKGTAGHRFADPQVKFSYAVEGVIYQGERYSRTTRYQLLTPVECENYVKAFLGSKSVTVWVDPINPKYAVLQPKVPVPWLEYAFLLLGGLVLACATYLSLTKKKIH